MSRPRSALLRVAAWRLAVLALPVVLAGCDGGISRTLGLTRDPPDEFTVTTRAPLSIPTEFTLPPPTPGASRPQELSERQQAEAALAPQVALAAPDAANSPGQQALLQATGPAAPANIRSEVNAEIALDQPKKTLADRLAFWRPDPPAGTAVDPKRESQRLRENAALGQSPDSGVTPIVQPKQQGFLQSLF